MSIINRGARALVATALFGTLSACGGGGGESTNGNGSSSPYVLFATDLSSGTIAAFTTLDPSAGQSLTAHIVKTQEGGTGIAYDAVHDDLYALRVDARLTVTTVDVFAHASTMVNGAAPSRSIQVPGFREDSAIAIDTTRDEVWVAGTTDSTGNNLGRLAVIAHASTASGSVTPSRDISGLPNFVTFALDRVHAVLYLGGGGGGPHGIYVYENASALVTGTPPTRTINGVDGRAPFLMAVDEQRDILYVPDTSTGLGIVRNASTSTQTVAKLAVPCLTVAVDSAHDRVYVGAYSNAYVFDNASTLGASSTVPAVAVQATGASIWSFAFP